MKHQKTEKDGEVKPKVKKHKHKYIKCRPNSNYYICKICGHHLNDTTNRLEHEEEMDGLRKMIVTLESKRVNEALLRTKAERRLIRKQDEYVVLIKYFNMAILELEKTEEGKDIIALFKNAETNYKEQDENQ